MLLVISPLLPTYTPTVMADRTENSSNRVFGLDQGSRRGSVCGLYPDNHMVRQMWKGTLKRLRLTPGQSHGRTNVTGRLSVRLVVT